jgi:hypothetical protein
VNLTGTIYSPPRAKAPWRLEDVFAPAALRHYAYGRQALAEALSLANVAGKTVLLPAFICREALAAVAAAGARPAFYGVKKDLTPKEEPQRWPDAAAVLAVDYFGWPQDLTPFEAYARRTSAVVIEDAAHALFSRDESGRLLGLRAPLGILSPRKTLPLPNGGTLVASDRDLAGRLPPQASFEPAPGRRAALKAAARPILALVGAKIAHSTLSAWRAARAKTPEGAALEQEMPKDAPCPELGRAIVCGDPSIEVSRRRGLWMFCRELSDTIGAESVFPSLPDGVAPYAFAFRARNPADAARSFAVEGLPVLPWPDLPAEIVDAAPSHYLDLFLVHFLW